MLTGCYSNRQIGLLQERDGIPTYDSVPSTVYLHTILFRTNRTACM